MKRPLLDILACPACHGGLTCDSVSEDIVDGSLTCTGCVVVYPIRGGIPRFVDEGYASSFGMQWNRFRKTQLDSASGTGLSAARFYAETGWATDWLPGKLVLDAGCGAGRFLEVAAASGARAVGVDISSAADAAKLSVAPFPEAEVIQASLFALPFKPGVFDAVYCIGVLQHTPDPARAMRALPHVLKAGGKVAVVAYERRRLTKLHTKYLIRPITKRLPKTALLRAIQMAMPLLFALTEVLFRLPLFGRVFRFVIPVANYVDEPRLSMKQRYDWAILDTFDMLSPAFDSPQTEPEVMQALSGEGVVDVRRRPVAGLTMVGIKG